MILLANGCSRTSGSEIEFHMQTECKEKAWPKHLADLMQCEHVNISEVGSCNERIKRTTIEWVIKNVQIQQNYKPQDVVAVIQWSGFDRFEEWNQRHKRFISSQSDAFYDEKLPEFKEYAKLKTVINTWASNEYRNLVEVLLTATYLESVGIKYYFINGVQTWSTRDKFIKTGLATDYDIMYRGYGEQRILRHLAFQNELELPDYQLRDIPKNPVARWPGHYIEIGHIAWAKILHDWINRVQ